MHPKVLRGLAVFLGHSLCTVLFSDFTEGTPSKILGDTRLREVVSGLEDSTISESDLDRLQQQTDGDLMGFSKGQGKVHPLGQARTRSRASWNQLASSSSYAKILCGAAG